MSDEVKQDNTRVNKPFKSQKFKLTQKQKDNIRRQQMSKRTQLQLYDKDKVDYYRNMQNIVNSSFFGAGFNSGQYRNNPMTEQGQKAIESSFNYAKTNVADFLSNVAGIGVQGAARKAVRAYSQFTKSPFKKTGGDLGKMNKYTKNRIIGEGAEAIVVKDTPTTVAKFTDIPVSEMTQRDAVANTIKHNYIGYVTKGKTKFPTYVQQKVKVLTEKTFPKHIKKLDKSMKKNGFKRVEDPNVYGRAYTDGKIVVDDIAEGNVGLTSGNPWLDKILPDWMKSPKIIDMAYQTVPEWRAMGYKLQKGGKLYKGSLPFKEVIVYPSQEQQRNRAAKRAEDSKISYRNWTNALDMTDQEKDKATNRDSSNIIEYIKTSFGRTCYDCINTASHWVTNNQTISKNKSLFTNPKKYGFKKITNPQRGDLVQYIDKDKNPYHAGIILSNNSNGITVKSSTGYKELNPIRYYNSDGSSKGDYDDIKQAIYYRYTYPRSGVYFE